MDRLGRIPEGFRHWELADERGWTVASEAAPPRPIYKRENR
jgi:hypothetical protein